MSWRQAGHVILLEGLSHKHSHQFRWKMFRSDLQIINAN